VARALLVRGFNAASQFYDSIASCYILLREGAAERRACERKLLSRDNGKTRKYAISRSLFI